MKEEDLEIGIKVVIVGNGAVGKSSLIQRYCKGIFTKDYKKTIGVDFLERQIDVCGEDVRLLLWDTAGQEEFDAMTKIYYRGAQAAVLAFSTVDRHSFDAIRSWKKKVEDECGEIPMVLIQNKIDLVDHAVVEPEEVETLAREIRCRLYRTSVKEDLNVNQVFSYLAERYLEQLQDLEEEQGDTNNTAGGRDVYSTQTSITNGKYTRPLSATITLKPTKRKLSAKKHLRNACSVL